MRVPSASELHGPSLDGWRRHLEGTGALLPVDPLSLRKALARGTLPALARRTFSARASATLLDVDGQCATGAALLAGATGVAERLAGVGATPGSRILLALPTSVDFATAYFGVLAAGCSALLVNPSMTATELGRLVDVGAPVAGLVSPEVADAVGDLVDTAATTAVSRTAVLVVFADAGRRSAPRSRPAEPDYEAVLAWTSGSTGEPKGVPLSHANLVSSMRAVMAAWRWSPDDVVVHSLPLYHQHGLGALHALALGGGRTVIRSHFDPDVLASTLHEQRASVLLAVPSIYQRLVGADVRRERFASLRLAVSGSAPLPPSLFEQVTDLIGLAPVERYGMTESGLDVSNPYAGERRPGAIGFALPGVEAIVADTGGEEAATGEDGEIWLRGPQVFSGYLGSAGDDAFTPDGWLRTGDIGRVHPDDGTMSITGRLKDVIISGGLNVFPREVELVVERHPAVAEVAVAGVRSTRWGEAVVAFVVPRGGTPPSSVELDELCRHFLAPYKRPKRFVVVDELPRNHMGKIVRSSLSALGPFEPDG